MTGSFCVAAQDSLLAFLPVFGEERGISPVMIGTLLDIRAGGAMVSRAQFGPMVRRFGRAKLFLFAVRIAAVAPLSPAVDMPVAMVASAFAAIGFGSGISLTSSVALTMSIAPVAVRGTASGGTLLVALIGRPEQFSGRRTQSEG
ncbi:MFS transporter [Salipiger mangrovisoli]|uniref:Major facilitator superfamily (MFS) profile domain-containing protein n=1 Tax=Salipiger mangrovisoli TaxID=2865933 RepID=A0ABR9XAQ0_9RHOB|nr:hypothetical protein [Salipiger mangrovisoli]